jgi:hypothetical protein
MVMHRLYADLKTSEQSGIVSRIAGVMLIADGDRWPSDRVTHYGSASAKSAGVARALHLGGARGVSLDRARVHSLCDKQDVVCDARAVAARAAVINPVGVLKGAFRVHTTHYPKHKKLRAMVKASIARAKAQRKSLVLGAVWAPNQQGYGKAAPKTVYNGGSPSGMVRSIRWKNWGGAVATGTGLALYIAPGQPVSQGTWEQATVVAFNLGMCGSRRAYNAVDWYLPHRGGRVDPNVYINACTGDYVGP